MRELWRRWRVRWQRRRMASTPPHQWPGGNGGVYRNPSSSRNQRPAAYRPIRPSQVRSHQFRSVSGITGRGGLDPADVAAFLDRVAHDLGIVYAELERTWEQNDRIKDALRRWQSSHAATATPSGYR